MVSLTRFFILIYLLPAFAVRNAQAQCQVNVDVGPDTTVCSSDKYTIIAEISGNVLDFRWRPENDLLMPFTLQPVVVAKSDTDFSLTVRGFDENQNLLVNGDFSEGDAGFTSQYKSQSTSAGGYLIGTLGTQLFPEAKPCEDRTGGGNMMMVKVSDAENVDIWCQEITVQPNQEYHFRTFATGLRINNPPVIYLTINDELVSSGTLGSFACSWQLVKSNWLSETNTTAKICLSVSDEDIGDATDFALDDMGFYEICEVVDMVSIGIIPFEVFTDNTRVEMPCNESIQLEASVESSGGSLNYEWSTTDGNILAGQKSLQATIDAPGTYQLEVTRLETEMTCKDKITIEVEEVSKEELSILEPEVLNCNNSAVELWASHSGPASDFIYQWSTSNGNILSGENSPVALVNAPGRYTLELEDIVEGCSTSETVEVSKSQPESFEYDLNLPDCNNPLGMLIFQSVFGGTGPYSYSIDGGIQFFEEPIFPELASGVYELIARDGNGCEIKDSIQIPEYESLELDLPPNMTLTKGKQSPMPISVNLPLSSIEKISWSPERGLSCTDCLRPDVSTGNTTIYEVEIVDINGCISSAMIQIFVVDEAEVYVPNGFSPNGDGHNEVFLVFGDTDKISKVKSLRIFDRNGALVFQKENFLPNDPSAGWSGRLNGELLNPGVFIYLTEVEFRGGRKKIFSGTITLLL